MIPDLHAGAFSVASTNIETPSDPRKIGLKNQV